MRSFFIIPYNKKKTFLWKMRGGVYFPENDKSIIFRPEKCPIGKIGNQESQSDQKILRTKR
jgi:hypothetical protein